MGYPCHISGHGPGASRNLFLILKLVPIAFLFVNICRYLVFSAETIENMKNDFIREILPKEVNLTPFSYKINVKTMRKMD